MYLVGKTFAKHGKSCGGGGENVKQAWIIFVPIDAEILQSAGNIYSV
jgi:hypothetical protein